MCSRDMTDFINRLNTTPKKKATEKHFIIAVAAVVVLFSILREKPEREDWKAPYAGIRNSCDVALTAVSLYNMSLFLLDWFATVCPLPDPLDKTRVRKLSRINWLLLKERSMLMGKYSLLHKLLPLVGLIFGTYCGSFIMISTRQSLTVENWICHSIVHCIGQIMFVSFFGFFFFMIFCYEIMVQELKKEKGARRRKNSLHASTVGPLNDSHYTPEPPSHKKRARIEGEKNQTASPQETENVV